MHCYFDCTDGEKNKNNNNKECYCCCCVDVLRPFDTFQVISGYQHCSWASLLDSLLVLSAHYLASNWQLPFLNQRKGENGRIKLFHDQTPRKNVAGREDRTRDRPHTRRMRIRSSYRARQEKTKNKKNKNKKKTLFLIFYIIPKVVKSV